MVTTTGMILMVVAATDTSKSESEPVVARARRPATRRLQSGATTRTHDEPTILQRVSRSAIGQDAEEGVTTRPMTDQQKSDIAEVRSL